MIMLYGASDDLIEVEGDVTEEWMWSSKILVFLSTGHVFSVDFDGDWRFRLLAGDPSVVTIRKSDAEEMGTPNDDVVLVSTRVEWVGCDDRLERS